MMDSPPQLLMTAGSLAQILSKEGYAILSATGLGELLGEQPPPAPDIDLLWDRLPADGYLRDGGHYRQRRHSCHVLQNDTGQITTSAQRAHWQPVDYNALHGGIERWYEPIEPTLRDLAFYHTLLRALGAVFCAVRPCAQWSIESHQFRIDTEGGIGRPTPEGAHRDGVDFVAVILIARESVRGGETRVFQASGPHGVRFTMAHPWTALLLDDARVIHETSPVQPLGARGHRDTLVLTYRHNGFQGPL